MCTHSGCPVKEKCYRFTANPSESQSYFSGNPSTVNDGKFYCTFFWGENAEWIMNKLTDITKPSK